MNALLIDDDAHILSSFQADLLAFEDSVGLVSVASGRAARQVLANRGTFDFIVLDLQLREDNGFELLAELCHAHPTVSVIALSGSALNADAVRSIYLGAVAYVPKHSGGRGLIAALRAVAAGELNVSAPAVPPAGAWSSPVEFTSRQSDVLALLMLGQSNKSIARSLNLAVDTVKDHVTAVLRCLNVQSRTQAVVACSGTVSGRSVGDRSWPVPAMPAAQSKRPVQPQLGGAAR